MIILTMEELAEDIKIAPPGHMEVLCMALPLASLQVVLIMAVIAMEIIQVRSAICTGTGVPADKTLTIQGGPRIRLRV